jgi:hypothetical protein
MRWQVMEKRTGRAGRESVYRRRMWREMMVCRVSASPGGDQKTGRDRKRETYIYSSHAYCLGISRMLLYEFGQP